MMFKPHKAISLLAIAGLALASTAANAAFTTFATDDLILGVRQDSNSGSQASTAMLVDIGQASLYTAGTNVASINLGSGFGTLMNSTFGAGWSTDPTVHWGIVGTSGASGLASGLDTNANVLYATGTSSTPYAIASDAAQGNATSTIVSFDSTFFGFGASRKTANPSLSNGLLQNLTTSNGWGVNNPGTGNSGTSFGYFSNLEANFNTGTPSNMNLYRMDDGGGTVTPGTAGSTMGSFTFTGSGTTAAISFTANTAAVPEPARAAFLGLGLGALLFRRRRRC